MSEIQVVVGRIVLHVQLVHQIWKTVQQIQTVRRVQIAGAARHASDDSCTGHRIGGGRLRFVATCHPREHFANSGCINSDRQSKWGAVDLCVGESAAIGDRLCDMSVVWVMVSTGLFRLIYVW